MLKFKSLLIVLVSALFLYFTPADDQFILELAQKLNSYNQKFPQEKVYLQSDKSVYKPGEDLWFKAYIVESVQHMSSSLSKDLMIKLIDEDGNDVFNDRFKIKKGKVKGDFKIPKSLEDGIYALVAYTNWMQNGPLEDVFSQEIIVINSVLPQFFIHIGLNDTLYHPADDIQAEIRIRSRNGEPIGNLKFEFAVIMGDKILKKGKQKTNEEGTAQISFRIPKKISNNLLLLNVKAKYKKYTETRSIVIPTFNNSIDLQFFPESGYIVNGIKSNIGFMAMDKWGNPVDFEGEVIDQKGKIVAKLKSFHDGMGAFSLTPESDGYYKVRITKPPGVSQTFDLPKPVQEGVVLTIEELDKESITVKAKTSGATKEQTTHWVAQVRGKIYWAANVSIGDSIMFKIPTEQFPIGIAQISIFDSTGALKAERLIFVNKHKKMSVKVTPDKTEYGPGEKAALTIKVQDENGFPISADLCLSVIAEGRLYRSVTPNILSTFLIDSELKGKIVNPNFYFEKSPRADKALDYLLMTHKWRRFDWDKIMEMSENKEVSYPRDRGLTGTVYDKDKKPVKDATVWLINTSAQLLETKTNDEGKFQFLSDGTTVLDVHTITAKTPSGSKDVQIVLDKAFDEKMSTLFTLGQGQKIHNMIKLDHYKYAEDWEDATAVANAILIDENFSKTEKAIVRYDEGPYWKKYLLTRGIYDVIAMIKPYRIIGTAIVFQGVKTYRQPSGALIVVDGVKIGRDHRVLETINPIDVEDIKIYTSAPDIQRFTSFGADGVIEITTKRGREQSAINEIDQQITNPFWAPNIHVDETGETNIVFYNPDLKISLLGMIQGITDSGKIGVAEFHYSIVNKK